MLELRGKRIVITGSSGFLGSWIIKELLSKGVRREDIALPVFPEYDLRSSEHCLRILKKGDIIIHLAARLGTVRDQQAHPGEFFLDNILIGTEMLEAARISGAEKILLVGSINSYPAALTPPFREKNLWDGYPEKENASYGLAKRLLDVQSRAYRAQYGLSSVYVILPNLYGPGYDILKPSTFISLLVQKFFDANAAGEKTVFLQGTGSPSREFFYVEDAARGLVEALCKYDNEEPLNMGSGDVVILRDLAALIAEESGFSGEIKWDGKALGPDAVRFLDSSRAKQEIGFVPKVGIQEGIRRTIAWYRKERAGVS